MILADAKKIAEDVVATIGMYCDIINIAGSIRREKAEPKDIEIVALPKTEVSVDLFGEPNGTYRIHEWAEVEDLGKVVKGNRNGKMMQIELPQGIMLDLFMPDDFDYYRQFAIRTGSADWTARFIAGGWKNKGWCGSDKGLRLIYQCEGKQDKQGKTTWKYIVPESKQTKPPHWKSEEEFFQWLGMRWIEPKYRNILP